MVTLQPHGININHQALRWVLRLRWALIAMVLALVVLAHAVLGVVLSWLPMGLMLVAWSGFNAVAQYALAAHGLPKPSLGLSRWVAGHIAIDVLVLSWFLYWTGGATNPFVSFYLPLLGLAAVFLPWVQVVLLGVLSMACYSGLMVWYQPLALANPHAAAHHHVQGMWLNFVLSAVVLMGLVARLGQALRQRDEALLWAQLRLAADERLAALGNGFAATAHQLGTPLSVLAMTLADLQDQAQGSTVVSQEDLHILAQQVQLMQQVLHQLRLRVQQDPYVLQEVPTDCDRGRNAQGLAALQATTKGRTNLYAWLEQACADWRNTCPAQVLQVLPWHGEAIPWLALPEHVLAIAFKVLMDNALQAHARFALEHGRINYGSVPVVVSVRDNAKHWVLAVQDQGGGVAPALLPRLGYDIVESNASQGMGLYLLNALLMRLGGCLQIKNIQGGAQVEAHFPKAV